MIYSEIVRDVVRLNLHNNFYKGGSTLEYRIGNDETNKIRDMYNSDLNKNNLDDLIGKIKVIDDTYRLSDYPEYIDPGFERMPSVSVDADTIRENAIESLGEYKNKSIDSINSDYDSRSQKLLDAKDDLAFDLESQKSNVSSYYDSARTRSSNDALDRGLARSSIIINVLDAFDNNEIADLRALDDEYTKSLNTIDFQLNSLKLQREKALSDFDISYAVKLGDKISSLTADMEKKRSEVIKYNNEIAEKEKKYLDNYNKLVLDIKKSNISNSNKMVELVGKYGDKAINRYRKNQIFDLLDEYFANMSKDTALDVLNTNDTLKDALGSDFDEYIGRYQ